ncbi:glycosyl hydrolase family 28-related protein [Novipirellula artificiosorum]|uniref:Pectate lyase superfamily protein n=1 Tax=Novipirellula artificiosorum TaxID=2528016 RepID=A0A5C6DA84_9BACT|nr:glycosyl hydrolase family 28-related protein [Novipirellula artificiosorum]TWU31749.1 Pectate lyase superfamily protein [Novipirellula artificiosorum]
MNRRLLTKLLLTLFWGSTLLADKIERANPSLPEGFLDITKAPYFADASGTTDSTDAIQRAVNDARDQWKACFFPEGTYLISDTISCEQLVRKLDRPRSTDNRTQHYWDLDNRIVMIGSTRGKRPVLKLSNDAEGFDDSRNPKLAVWIWAQTRDDAPGNQEPIWGKEQPNISFSHIFKGIDIDIRGHAGAIGIRHSGSQGSTLQDVTVNAEGAYAGLSNCCGQGGGTYNVEVVGGTYGITIDRESRFPLLVGCSLRDQTAACVHLVKPNQMPTLIVGSSLKPAGTTAIQFPTLGDCAGVSLVDCVVEMPAVGDLCASLQNENIFLEDVIVRGVGAVRSSRKPRLPSDRWTHIHQYSEARGDAVRMVNGETSAETVFVFEAATEASVLDAMRQRHYPPMPSLEDNEVVSVRDFGAKGDGKTDDTQAFRSAIAASDQVFVPPGNYHMTGQLALRHATQLFGVAAGITSIGNMAVTERGSKRVSNASGFTITTPRDPNARPLLAFLSVRGQVQWNSGKGTCMLAPARMQFSATGGGKIFGAMARGGPMVFKGTRQPLEFYALNVERVSQNPQSIFDDCRDVRVYFFKVEAGSLNREEHPDANTPCRIQDSRNVRVYCMYGVVRHLTPDRPMMEIVNCDDVQVSQLQAFHPGVFPHLVEASGGQQFKIPSSSPCALFLRDQE